MKKIILPLIIALFVFASCNADTPADTEAGTKSADPSSIAETEAATEEVTESGSEGATETESDSETTAETPSFAISDEIDEEESPLKEKNYYTVELDDGKVIPMGEMANKVLPDLGDPQSLTEAPSCVYEGVDKLRNYGAYTVTTSPDANGNERISEFSFKSDAVSMKNGISIGSDKTAVEAVFGKDYTETFGVLKFTLEGAEISVVLADDGTVSALTVTAK